MAIEILCVTFFCVYGNYQNKDKNEYMSKCKIVILKLFHKMFPWNMALQSLVFLHRSGVV